MSTYPMGGTWVGLLGLRDVLWAAQNSLKVCEYDLRVVVNSTTLSASPSNLSIYGTRLTEMWG